VLITIIKDVRAFLAVIVLVMLMFAHLLFLLLGTNNTGSATNSATQITDWVKANNMTALEGALEGDWETKFDTMSSTAATLFSMTLWDYDPDQFPDTFSYLISVEFMFMIVIVMLNRAHRDRE